MKFYVTVEGINKLKKSFLNLKIFQIIDVNNILKENGYTIDTIDDYGAFIISNIIADMISSYSKSKRIRGIIYSNPYVNIDILQNIFDLLYDNPNINEVVLLDDYNVPKLKYLYCNFDEILFFPSHKKVRLIECTPFKVLSPSIDY